MTADLTPPLVRIASRANPFIKTLKRMAQDSTAYRKESQVWLEGDHLCRAALSRSIRPEAAVFSESFWPGASAALTGAAKRNVVIPDALWSEFSGLESPAPLGFVMALPTESGVLADASTVILDRVQDAGNVGSILRSAAAFGFKQVLAIKGTAALWSPKVLRAGMGAHFGLHLMEGLDEAALHAVSVPIYATSSHGGVLLHEATLPMPCAWILGHEGQGVSPGLMTRATQLVRIAQPGGEESLNVGAAAAICLHASAAQALLASHPRL